MSWDQEPPSKQEIALSTDDWFNEPPSDSELSAAPVSQRPEFKMDWENPATSLLKNSAEQGLYNLQKASEFVDKYTGAPVRKFVTETVTGEKLKKAPSGAEQAIMMGASEDPLIEGLPDWLPGKNISPSDIAGVGLEVVQDPFLIGSGIKKGASLLAKGAVGVGDALRGSKQVAKAIQSQAADASGEQVAKSMSSVAGGGLEVKQGGKLFEYKAPKSLEELREWKPDPGVGEMPGMQRLEAIEQIVPDLRTKPLKYHYDMMENPKAMKELKLQFENLPTEDAKKIASYNQQIVHESGMKAQDAINSISGGIEPRTLTDAGYDFIGAAKQKYNAEKEALGPIFEEIRTKSNPISPDESRMLSVAIGENSKLGKLMAQDPDSGRIFLNKNTPRSGVSDAEHGILKRVIDDLNDGMTFEELQKTREFLRKAIDPANPGAGEEISKVRSILLGQMEEMASKRGPKVGDTFKAYAKNERARESIEKVIGGKIESLDAMFAANPDKVVQKIFSNPNYAKVVGDYVGPEKMQELVAAYVSNGTRKAFDPARGFDPSALRNWMKSNGQFVSAYMDPGTAQRLEALADYGYYGKRFLDEVNPSGTAASLQALIEPKSFFQKVKQEGITGAVTNEISQKIGAAVKQKQATRTLNESLGGTNPEVAKYLMRKFSDKLPGPKDILSLQGANAVGRGALGESLLPRVSNEEKETANTFEKKMDKGALMQKAQGTKYAQVLENAASNGDQSFAAAHFVMSSRDPEYRKVIGEDDEGNQ